MFYIRACKGLARAQALGQKSLGLQALKSPGFWKALYQYQYRLRAWYQYQYRYRLGAFLSIGISPGIDWGLF